MATAYIENSFVCYQRCMQCQYLGRYSALSFIFRAPYTHHTRLVQCVKLPLSLSEIFIPFYRQHQFWQLVTVKLASSSYNFGHFGRLWVRVCNCLEQRRRKVVNFKHLSVEMFDIKRLAMIDFDFIHSNFRIMWMWLTIIYNQLNRLKLTESTVIVSYFHLNVFAISSLCVHLVYMSNHIAV